MSVFLDIDPNLWVASNELAFAIRDGFPVTHGHVLVIPRREFADWFEATAEEREAIFELVDHVKAKFDASDDPPDGYNIGINVGSAAGQTVFHLHVHVIPRRVGDMADPRGGVRHVIPHKGNYRAERPPALAVGGDSDPFLEHLKPLLTAAHEIDVVAAFVQDSGLELLERRIHSALERGAAVRLLCGDYLHITQQRALRRLLDFQEGTSLEESVGEVTGTFRARVVETSKWNRSFHPKSWQFHTETGGTAFVGSSNISRSALTSGVEWNLRVDRDVDPIAFDAIAAAFDDHWNRATPLTEEWVDGYQERISHVSGSSLPPGEEDADEHEAPQPHELQRRALRALRQARSEGRQRALTVLATGLGKTWLSAFDVQRFATEIGRPPSVLFIAHRAEILRQATQTFRKIYENAKFGYFAGSRDEIDADVVFASVQKLSRGQHLEKLRRDQFDYIIVDEVHHATADSYRRVLDRLDPEFMLGLTATPDRNDGADVLSLFDDYMAEEVGIAEGIEAEWLVPFKYFGVKDSVDFEPIPWRSGKFSTEALTAALATQERMERLEEVLAEHPAKRTLVFCCSIAHALFVRDWLRGQGRRAAAIVSASDGDDRESSLEQLGSGVLEFICAVDILNEGVDIPAIDRVVMLRPTESSIVFMQQLGRGLRISDGKEHLIVIDFVGNHAIFLERLRWILSLGVSGAVVSLQRFLNGEGVELPGGCSVELELEAKDLLRDLLPKSSRTAIVNAFREISLSRGTRPSVTELYRQGYDPRKLRSKYGGWAGFLRHEGAIGLEEPAFLELQSWFDEVERTSMTKAFKMVVLNVVLDASALFSGMPLEDLAAAAYRMILRSPELFDDIRGVKALAPDPRAVSDAKWLAYWKKNPVNAWTNSDYFEMVGDHFYARLPGIALQNAEVTESITRELVEYRLAEYRARRRGTFYARVVRNSSDNPILMFGSRTGRNIPEGEVLVEVDETTPWTFRFVKIAVNVAAPDGESGNHLPRLLTYWFGADAGVPGENQRVRFERAGGNWFARPVY